jgi:branched-chain amino acid transport system substrate-binding protein
MNSGASAQATGEPIPVGGAIALTGWGAGDGQEIKNGLELAIEEINAAGGILGRPLELYVEDTKDQGADLVIQAIQRLIDRNGVHAIINGYNAGTLTAEYDTIADAGIIYMHHNTDIIHHKTVGSDPERYFGCFMGDPADVWYGPGTVEFISQVEASGAWKRANNKVFIITGSDNNTVTMGNAIAQACKDTHAKYGWEVSQTEVVVTPISEWGPTLAKIREDQPAVIIMAHWAAQDQAQFMLQFIPNPTNSLIYMQYGPSLQAFRDIGGEAVVGVTYSSVVAHLQDPIGLAFAARYKAKFGDKSTPLVGCESYDCCWHWALAAAIAGGTGGPGEEEQNRKVSAALRRLIYRGVNGVTRYWRDTPGEEPWPFQAAIPYPDATSDPSLGMPHQYFQIQALDQPPTVVTPVPYTTGPFVLAPWMKA